LAATNVPVLDQTLSAPLETHRRVRDQAARRAASFLFAKNLPVQLWH
jgi:hypothetical protein